MAKIGITDETSTNGDSEPAPPPIPGRTVEEKLTAMWRLCWGTNNRTLELHAQTVELTALALSTKREARYGFAALGVKMPKELFASEEMRPEAPSGLNLEEFAQTVKAAALVGERTPGTDADREVERVLDRWQKKREEKREYAQLRAKAEADAKAKAAAVETRKRRIRKIVDAVAAGLALTGAAELLKYVATLYH